MSSNAVLELVSDQNSPENNRRTAAELQFNKLAAENPTQVAFELIQGACGENQRIDIRQACLLHLKRLVPKFWSLGFQSFVGPPIDQELKTNIRSSLIHLVSSESNSKIRSGAAYVIVQIAAADYPDEWPDLLVRLYDLARDLNNHVAVVGSLSVLTDLFDDLITEEQFWEGGVGAQLLSYITNLLSQESLPATIKTSALKLYLTVYNTLSSAEAVESPERKAAVTDHIAQMFMILGQLLQQSNAATANSVDLSEIYLRTNLYKVIAHILSTYRKRIGKDLVKDVLSLILQDLTYSSNAFKVFAVDGEDGPVTGKSDDLDDPARVLTNNIAELLSTLSLIQDSIPLISNYPAEVFDELTRNIVQCSVLPLDVAEDYMADFNQYVTEITGLSGITTARDAVRDYIMDLGDKDASHLFEVIKNEAVNSSLEWRVHEAYLLIAESLFSNEQADSLGADLPLSQYVSTIDGLINTNAHPLVLSRIFILLPKFIEKFSSKLSVNDFGSVQFKKTYAFASSSNDDSFKIVQASTLVAATFWKQVPGLDLTIMGLDSQRQIVEVSYGLLEDSEEDTPPVIMEALAVAIDVDQRNAFNLMIDGDHSVIDIIIKSAFKDPANIQLSIDSAECLETLLNSVSMQEYLQVCDRSLPFVIKIVAEAASSKSVEYSPQLNLALDLLGNILSAAPSEPDAQTNSFPKEVFDFAFPVLRQLILRASDDQILQSGAEVFNSLLQKAPNYFVEYSDPSTNESGMNIIVAVAGKFLSPELSDSAAMNCGLIVASLFENFQSYLDNDFFYQLLSATVRRLVIAKAVVTIENLIMVFCKLVLNASPENLINALTAVEVVMPDSQQQRNGLEAVLPIWFNAFEVTRGYQKIQQNVLALGKLYSINDSRVSSMIVDGDIIPYEGDIIITRSKAKSMPQKFTQISAPVKILKLLANELGFQCQQPNADDYNLDKQDEDEEEGDGGDWEDLDDIGVPTYEKLKSYVDSDSEEDGDAAPVGDQTVKDMLLQFFKECVSKNLGNFQQYYEALDDDEKKILTENIVF
ncbi:hypothetical protein FT663_00159 [Candidozyma haemuli var. vulneris]|uniref:Importin N-terminal domain-containing protein n=1 Tax=Candidozyma haemuli TaxID=45357 RepID=A0A2V1AL28_9ASCO|nr:hypothetical protein CXQ85_001048 [[Candida] haemuloni]KAF3994189.1 hypothetical protein FT662_00058 [[Candida] haemuloni var. vulneris]KAF3995737.1 hypothetical protein FT663_00159 [[Candida] haemuloni var. vulneris]PVH18760.1 hypothetical protein CXQ85_001048 [[Candida] haemuloni]